MQYWGKLFGLISGLFSGAGFWGALLGLMIGHVWDTRNTRHQRIIINQQVQRELFLRTTFQIMGQVTKSKGRVTEMDIARASQWMDRLQLHGKERLAAQQAFREGKRNTFPWQDRLRELHALCDSRASLTRTFMEIQCHMAFSDGLLHANAWHILQVIARELNVPPLQLERYIRMMEQQQTGSHTGKNQYSSQRHQHAAREAALADAWKVLGVNQNADSITIKRAWRKLMSEHHPDKLTAKNISPEDMEKAKQKTQQIQAAYDLIKREKGFK